MVNVWDASSCANRLSKTRMCAWWEAAYERQSADQILAHHLNRCRNDLAPAVDRWLYHLHCSLSTDHDCFARIMDAERQRWRCSNVCGRRQWFNWLMVQPPVYFWKQHQRRTLVRNSRRTCRRAYAFPGDRFWKESGECLSVFGFHGGRLFHCRFRIWIFAEYSAAALIYDLAPVICCCLHQLRLDHRTDLCHEPGRESLAERDGICSRWY